MSCKIATWMIWGYPHDWGNQHTIGLNLRLFHNQFEKKNSRTPDFFDHGVPGYQNLYEFIRNEIVTVNEH